MEFSNEELNLFRQWYNAVFDLNPKYLNEKDEGLYKKVCSLYQQPHNHQINADRAICLNQHKSQKREGLTHCKFCGETL